VTTSDSTRPDLGTPTGTRGQGHRTTPGAGGGLTRAVALALAAAVVVLLPGGTYVLTTSTTYESAVDVLVTPATGTSDNDAAALFDSLSKGQVAATAAEIFRQQRWKADRNGSIEAGVVTPSAVVQVVGRAASRRAARELVQSVVTAATPEVNRDLDPYRVSRLDAKEPAATPVGLSRRLRLGLVLLAALVVGGAALRLLHPRGRVAGA